MDLLQRLEGHTDRVWSVAFSPDGSMLCSCSGDKTIRVWNKDPRKDTFLCTAILEETHSRTVRYLAWSPNGRHLAAASFDSTVSIWEHHGGSWENITTLQGHENEVKGVAWSPDGRYLATCGRDKTVWIWESMPGGEMETVDVKQGHSQDVKAVAWHPSGEALVSASYDDSIKLWSDSGDDEWNCIQTLSGEPHGHRSTVWGVAFSPAGDRMVSCSGDLTLKVWEWGHGETGKPLVRHLATLSGYFTRTVFCVDWSKGGLIAAAAGDNSVRLFAEGGPPSEGAEPGAPPSFQLVASVNPAHDGDVNGLRFSPADPTLLATCADDGEVRLWRVTAKAEAAGGSAS